MRNASVFYLIMAGSISGCGGAAHDMTNGSTSSTGGGGGTDLLGAAPVDLGRAGPDLSPASPDLAPAMLAVTASENVLAMDGCRVSPAPIPDLPAGSYTITLSASTLSKGQVTITPPVQSLDNYVIVELPLGANDAEADHRFFMLNGVGASATFTLTQPGTVQLMFVDSDSDSNSGQATVAVNPGNYQATVDAVANVLRWGPEGCNSNPAMAYVTGNNLDIEMMSSTLSCGPGMSGNYVLVRLPSVVAQDDFRYLILNGLDATHLFDVSDSTSLRAWYLDPSGGTPSGQAMLRIGAQLQN